MVSNYKFLRIIFFKISLNLKTKLKNMVSKSKSSIIIVHILVVLV